MVTKWLKWSYYLVIGIFVIFSAVLWHVGDSTFLKAVIITHPYISLYLAIGSGLVLGLEFSVLYELYESHRKPTSRSRRPFLYIIIFVSLLLSIFLIYTTTHTYFSELNRISNVTDPVIRESIIGSLSSDIIIICLLTISIAMYTVSIIAYFMRFHHSKALINQV